jgi:hypothetical protein
MKASFYVIARQIRPGLILCTAALGVLAGCAQIQKQPRKEVIQKSITAPPPVACCSATGHIPTNIPYILGGNCFCTPSRSLVEAMHAAGFYLDVDYDSLVQMYKNAGITTDLDHKGCNNLCSHGPHVAFGGKCMATPTPGTRNYERVLGTIVEPDSGKTK